MPIDATLFGERVPEFEIAGGVKAAPTVAELVEAYKKVSGADARFREAAELREKATKDAAQAAELNALMEKFRAGDPNAFVAVMTKHLGLPYEDTLKVWNTLTGDEAAASDDEDTSKGKQSVAFDPKTLPPDILADLQYVRKIREAGGLETLDAAAKLANSDARRRATPAIQQALTSNPILSKILRAGGSRDALANRTLDEVEEAVNNGVPYATAIQQGVAKIAAFAKDLGVESLLEAPEQPNVFGLGGAPGNGRGLRLTTPQEVKAPEGQKVHERGAVASFADAVIQQMHAESQNAGNTNNSGLF